MVVALVVVPEAWAHSSEPFNPESYLSLNETIVEGTVLVVEEIEPVEWGTAYPGWRFPTNRGEILVSHVYRTSNSVGAAVGDTIHFTYRASGDGYHPKHKDQEIIDKRPYFEGEFIEGMCGLFSFAIHPWYGNVPGSWFILTEKQMAEVIECLHRGEISK